MLRPLRPQSHTRTVVQPQSSSRLLFSRHFPPFPPPDPLHPVLAHLPSCLLEQRRDPSIAIPAVLAGQRDDRSRQGILVPAQNRNVPLCSSPLPQQPAGVPLGKSVFLACTLYRTTPPLGASKFPCATSRRTCFSRESSATNRFNRLFSFSSSLSRFAWSSFSPPNSFRQR